jgi:hypothetical protein
LTKTIFDYGKKSGKTVAVETPLINARQKYNPRGKTTDSAGEVSWKDTEAINKSGIICDQSEIYTDVLKERQYAKIFGAEQKTTEIGKNK